MRNHMKETKKKRKKERPKIEPTKAQCLRLKTPDEKVFFTQENNFPQLVEFAKTYDVEISVVNPSEPVIIQELEDLATAICEQLNYKDPPNCEIIEIKIPSTSNTILVSKQKVEKTKEIYDQIKQEFLSGEVVTLQGLFTKFGCQGLTKATICNYVRKIQRELTTEGYSFTKPGRGQ